MYDTMPSRVLDAGKLVSIMIPIDPQSLLESLLVGTFARFLSVVVPIGPLPDWAIFLKLSLHAQLLILVPRPARAVLAFVQAMPLSPLSPILAPISPHAFTLTKDTFRSLALLKAQFPPLPFPLAILEMPFFDHVGT